MFVVRMVAVLAATSMLMTACGRTADHPPTSARPGRGVGQAGPPACGDGTAMLAAMSTRDKLAQLLMVGVRNAGDAKVVVANHHVGGIFIGSWTDLSMLTDGSLTAIARSAAHCRWR
ncbi:beta-N-acetylhexosaminidase domain protein [Mycobacterium xenopi 4042]|uniref:Beta-N-acetylhexosaminidase domain protein n=1 Tax=Mycobacterium xenopi 4042 TaxID=1299334 RepID=X7Z9K0_MYCXE|nr:beta-N-acetylhexosaminidase domain protein [Mycobacterium xenopi 4042]